MISSLSFRLSHRPSYYMLNLYIAVRVMHSGIKNNIDKAVFIHFKILQDNDSLFQSQRRDFISTENH